MDEWIVRNGGGKYERRRNRMVADFPVRVQSAVRKESNLLGQVPRTFDGSHCNRPVADGRSLAGLLTRIDAVGSMLCRWAIAVFVPVQLAAVTLLDIGGNKHTLPADPESSATIIYFVTHDCPISDKYAPEIRRICDEYRSSGVKCLMAYVDPTVTAGSIREH